MSYREGKMNNPGRGESVWKADQDVTTDPASPDFLDERMFETMAREGAIDERGIDAAARKTKPKRRRSPLERPGVEFTDKQKDLINEGNEDAEP